MPYGPIEELEIAKTLDGCETISLFSLAICILELRERIAKLEEKIEDDSPQNNREETL